MTKRKRSSQQGQAAVFETQAAQGDLLLRRIDKLPADTRPVAPVDGQYLVGHSETGHHHVVAATDDVSFYADPQNPMVCYLQVDGLFADLVHLRPHDTHQPLRMPTGVIEIRRAREYVPEGWRPVRD